MNELLNLEFQVDSIGDQVRQVEDRLMDLWEEACTTNRYLEQISEGLATLLLHLGLDASPWGTSTVNPFVREKWVKAVVEARNAGMPDPPKPF